MVDSRIVRIFRFRPVRPDFDDVLRRRVLPDLVATPAVDEVLAGRRDHPVPGQRVVVSIWRDLPAMTAVMGDRIEASEFHPELLDESADREILVGELAFGDRVASGERPTVLRIVQGTVRAGELGAYTAEAQAGTVADRAAGSGPQALYLGVTGPDSFVTVSLWPDWATVQAATGGNLNRPIATRHAERLVAWTAGHYEIVDPD